MIVRYIKDSGTFAIQRLVNKLYLMDMIDSGMDKDELNSVNKKKIALS